MIFYKYLVKFSLPKQISILMSFVLILSFTFLNIGSRIVTQIIIRNSEMKKIEYNLQKIVDDVNGQLLNVSQTIDTIAVDERMIDYVYGSNGNDDYSVRKYINNVLKIYESSINYFECLLIVNEDGIALRYGNAYDEALTQYGNSFLKDYYNKSDIGEIILNGNFKLKLKEYNKDKSLYLISKKIYTHRKPIIVIVGVSDKMMSDITARNYLQKNETIAIGSFESNCFFSIGDVKIDRNTEEVLKSRCEEEIFTVNINNRKINVITNSSYLTNDKFFYLSDLSHSSRIYDSIIIMYSVFSAVIIFLLALMGSLSVKKMLIGLIDFSGKLNLIEKEYVDNSKIKEMDINNIVDVENVYSVMLAQAKLIFEEIQNHQKALNEIEMKVLQEQINPHFLYNTLETIRMMSEINDDTDVSNAIAVLGELLRYGLDIKTDNLIELRKEFLHIEKYVILMKYRLPYNVEIIYNANEEVLEKKVPKVMLQPIIENCFYHGEIGKTYSGKIYISSCVDNNTLVITVRDNGKGYSGNEISKSGIGLQNVRKRLKLHYGDAADLIIYDNDGAEVRIIIPIKEADYD